MATRQADHKRRHDAIEDTDPAAASVSLRPRSQRRVVPESLIAPKNRRDNDTSSTASLPPDEEELEVEMEGAEKKQRFVWTPDLHHRFEIAVHKLGVANAKPQAIQQLMGCEDDSTIPTRQNIKSHLQKYRLRTGHRSESGRSASSSGGSQAGGSQAGGSQAGGSQVGFAAPSQAPLDPIAQKQQTGLLEQLELQKKLDAQLLQQRNTQSALDLRMHTAGPGPTLRPAQLQRLARHVLIMRGMLQHLLTLLHAITVDFCAAGQFAQRSFASGPTQSEDEDECSSFETLMTSSATSGAGMGPIASMGEMGAPPSPALMCLPSLGLPQIDCTPLQSDRDEYDGSASPSHPLPSDAGGLSADADGEPASAEAMAEAGEAITSLAAYQRERAKLSQQIGAAQEALAGQQIGGDSLPRVLEAHQARSQLAEHQAQQQALQALQRQRQQQREALQQQVLQQQAQQQHAQAQLEHAQQQVQLQQAQEQAYAAAGRQEELPGTLVKLEPRVQALAPAAGERASWPEPTAAATDAGCSSDAAMLAAQAEHMPVCIGEKSWADRDAEARCSVIDVEAESAARAPATDAPAADAPAADATVAGAMPCEQQQAVAMAAGVAEESVPLAVC